jgi:hypothetical protein
VSPFTNLVRHQVELREGHKRDYRSHPENAVVLLVDVFSLRVPWRTFVTFRKRSPQGHPFHRVQHLLSDLRRLSTCGGRQALLG